MNFKFYLQKNSLIKLRIAYVIKNSPAYQLYNANSVRGN
jgi:hypothetical protein